MFVTDWVPRKPVRRTKRFWTSGDRLMREFHARTGRWPRTGIIHLDDALKCITRIEFEPEELRP